MFLSAALFVSGVASAITPETVGQMIDRHGAKRTVEKLANAAPNDTRTEFGDFDKVLDGIASGDSRWLALVPRLEPGTDAGTAESLRIVVAMALPRNPAGVLRLIVREPSWRDACSYPMIEPTKKEMRAYFKVAIPAVEAVRSPKLLRARRLCLAELMSVQRTP